MWAGAGLIKAMGREGHKWLESADKLPSTLLKCTATFFLLPSHQSSDCLSLITHLSLQPFATCSFLLRDQAEKRHGWTSVNLHNDAPLLIFSMKQFDVYQSQTRSDCPGVFIPLFYLPFCLAWTSLFILRDRTQYYHRPNCITRSSCLSSVTGLLPFEVPSVFRNRGKERDGVKGKPNGAKRKWETSFYNHPDRHWLHWWGKGSCCAFQMRSRRQ